MYTLDFTVLKRKDGRIILRDIEDTVVKTVSPASFYKKPKRWTFLSSVYMVLADHVLMRQATYMSQRYWTCIRRYL